METFSSISCNGNLVCTDQGKAVSYVFKNLNMVKRKLFSFDSWFITHKQFDENPQRVHCCSWLKNRGCLDLQPFSCSVHCIKSLLHTLSSPHLCSEKNSNPSLDLSYFKKLDYSSKDLNGNI